MTITTNPIGLLNAEIDSAGSLKLAGDRVIFGAKRTSEAETEWLARQKFAQCGKSIMEVVHKHGGIIAATIGDKMFCHLPDSESALSAACEIQLAQRAVAKDNNDDSGKAIVAPFSVRLAAHFGELEVDGGKLYGESVDILNAVLRLSELEQILVTEAALAALAAPERKALEERLDAGSELITNNAATVKFYRVAWEQDPPTTAASIC